MTFYPFESGTGYVVSDAVTEHRLRSVARQFRLAALVCFCAAVAAFPWWADAALILGPAIGYRITMQRLTRSLPVAPGRRTWLEAFGIRVRSLGWGRLLMLIGVCLAFVALGVELASSAAPTDRLAATAWIVLWTCLSIASVAMAIAKRHQPTLR